jgi:hypothetical protein
MRAILGAAYLLAIIGTCVWAAELPKLPNDALRARADYRDAKAKAGAVQADSLRRATEDYKKRLKEIMEKETKSGNLDGALAVREEIKGLDAPAKEGGSKTDPKADPPSRRMVTGLWSIKYHPNKTGGAIEVKPDGLVTYEDGKTKKGQLLKQGEFFVMESGERFERFTFAGNRLFIEHYLSKAHYERNEIDQIGVGQLVNKKK